MEELFKFYWGYGCKEGIFRERNYNLSVIRAMGARNAFLARETTIKRLRAQNMAQESTNYDIR
jgi:hypothetical protein